MIVEAPSQRAAEAIAAQRGMMVEQAIPSLPAAPVAAPVATLSESYKTFRRLFGIGFLVLAPLSVFGGDPILYTLATVSGCCWFIMAIGQK